MRDAIEKLHEPPRLVDRGYVVENGRVALEGPTRELLENPKIKAS